MNEPAPSFIESQMKFNRRILTLVAVCAIPSCAFNVLQVIINQGLRDRLARLESVAAVKSQ